jgi:hypothetical protein
VLSGSGSSAEAPLFWGTHPVSSLPEFFYFSARAGLIDFAGDGDAGEAESMGHLRVPEARGVLLESDPILLLVDAEFAQAVGISKPAETLELLEAERRLEFIGNFKKRQASDYSNWASF